MHPPTEIITPEVLFATGSNIPFRIISGEDPILNQNGSRLEEFFKAGEVDWFTHGLAVPVVANERALPFRKTSENAFKIPRFVKVTIMKCKNQPRLVFYLGKFGSLTKGFQHGTLHAIVSGAFGSCIFEHYPTSIPIREKTDEDDVGEIIVTDGFIENFNMNLRSRELKAEFRICIYWKLNFNEPKLMYIDTLLTLVDDMQHIEGTVSLIPKTGAVVKVSKGLLAATSPKFKAQFEQDVVNELSFTIDGQDIIRQQSLRALLKFITSFKLEQPMENCSTALDLLMAGHYHIFETLTGVMQDILLAKPTAWFDLETSVRLFSFANKVCSSQGETGNAVWHNLKWKAVGSVKSFSMEALQNFEAISSALLNPEELAMLRVLLSIT